MELRDLPSVDVLAGDLERRFGLPRPLTVIVARDTLAEARDALRRGSDADPVAEAARRAADLAAARPRRVVNATGVLLHTNLGRAPLPPGAAAAAAEQATGYGNVELDLVIGRRGSRARYLRALAAGLVGAPAALVVNNNAGALLLALAALGGPAGRVAVSRGELIEIGGSFRLPELMTAAGTRLVEVGTTNRTRIEDYASVAAEVDAILKVHPSNYRIDGFTATVGWSELAALAHHHGIPFVADVGSGLLDTRVPWLGDGPPAWLAGEPGVRQTLDAGADVVLFSGDKLLGGPQAGIAVGTAPAIGAMAFHPLARALRIDGPTAAALAAVLELYAAGRGGELPFWRAAALPADALRRRLAAVTTGLRLPSRIVEGTSLVGAGSVPGAGIPGPVLRIDAPADATWRALLAGDPPVVAARRDGATHLDLRSVVEGEDEIVATALAALEP